MNQTLHPKKERTLVLLKPDTIQRSLIGEIITRFEKVGLKMVGMKLVVGTEEQLWNHYSKDDVWFEKKGNAIVENRKKLGMPVEKEGIEYGRDIIRAIVHYMTSGPVVAMVWEGNQSVAVVKKLVGGTEPTTSDVGTIRGDFTLDSYYLCDYDGSRGLRNLIHCTDNPTESEREINLWFKENELINYRLIAEEILYDVNLDGILE